MQYLRIKPRKPIRGTPPDAAGEKTGIRADRDGSVLVPFEIVRSDRRTVALEITADLRVIVRAPRWLSDQAAESYADAHGEWILLHLGRMLSRSASVTARPYSEAELRRMADRLIPILRERLRHYSKIMDVTYGHVTIRNQKTRWGSCSSTGNLNFNVRLALVEPEILDYVVVHELAHRREMNHSAAFWAVVEKAMPDYRELRERLKKYAL